MHTSVVNHIFILSLFFLILYKILSFSLSRKKSLISIFQMRLFYCLLNFSIRLSPCQLHNFLVFVVEMIYHYIKYNAYDLWVKAFLCAWHACVEK